MSKPLIPAQRRERIQEYLAIHKIVRITDLCEMLETSDATIRRDLEWLEQQGVLERTHGGAMLSQRLNLEQAYQQRALRHPEEKYRIGVLAASLIEDGDIVFLNSGTTSTQVIRHIRPDIEATIITNNLIGVLETGEVNFEILVLGGSFQSKSNSVAGRYAINNLSQVYANKAFIGVDGISLRHGYTVPTSSEAEVVQLMCERTTGLITVISDSSKWGVVSNFEVASIDEMQRLITDDGLEFGARASLAAHSVDILIASNSAMRA